jgi:hypothetical protein
VTEEIASEVVVRAVADDKPLAPSVRAFIERAIGEPAGNADAATWRKPLAGPWRANSDDEAFEPRPQLAIAAGAFFGLCGISVLS